MKGQMVRAGGQALMLLSVPLNVEFLRALEDGPLSLTELRQAAGSPPETTTRKQLRKLCGNGLLERHQQPGFPGPVIYRLSQAGVAMLEVARLAEGWLRAAPSGPLELGGLAAKSAIKSLVDGWTSNIIRALVAAPLSLTQLDRLIAELNYPMIERRVGALRLCGQISSHNGEGRTRPYEVTPWLRLATAPLVAAAGWEHRYANERAASPGALDAESAFLLAVPLLRLPVETNGRVRLVVQFRGAGGESRAAGAMVEIEDGQVRSCVSRLEGDTDGWAAGAVGSWLEAVIDGEVDLLEFSGDAGLARAVVEGLHDRFLAAYDLCGR